MAPSRASVGSPETRGDRDHASGSSNAGGGTGGMCGANASRGCDRSNCTMLCGLTFGGRDRSRARLRATSLSKLGEATPCVYCQQSMDTPSRCIGRFKAMSTHPKSMDGKSKHACMIYNVLLRSRMLPWCSCSRSLFQKIQSAITGPRVISNGWNQSFQVGGLRNVVLSKSNRRFFKRRIVDDNV
jgi:hypothetical protein